MNVIKAIHISVNINGNIESLETQTEYVEENKLDYTKSSLEIQDAPKDEQSPNTCDEYSMVEFQNLRTQVLDDFDLQYLEEETIDLQLDNNNQIGLEHQYNTKFEEFTLFDQLLNDIDKQYVAPGETADKQTSKEQLYNEELEIIFRNLETQMDSEMTNNAFENMVFVNDEPILERPTEESKLTRGPYKKKPREVFEYKCEHCTGIFKQKYALNIHVTTVHNKEKEHICKTCNKKFGRISHLQLHEATHVIKQKFFECSTCHLKYKTAGSLKNHRNLHRRPQHVCGICDKKYYTNYQMSVHYASHIGYLDYECTQCDKKYVSSHKQRAHLRTHAVEKLGCACCSKKVKSVETLKAHLMKNHQDIGSTSLRKLVLEADNLKFDYDTLKYVPKY